jgi:hypothetical protein
LLSRWKLLSKPWNTAEFSIAHPKRELALEEKNRRQAYIWRSCSSFLVGVCCFLILLLIQRTRLRKHIVGMCVNQKQPCLLLQLHDGWGELVIETDLNKPDWVVGEFLHVSIQLINIYYYCRAVSYRQPHSTVVCY